MKYIIYCLIDPHTNEIRYVGKSHSGLKRARELHKYYCGQWMRNLRCIGARPIVRIIQTFDNPIDLRDAEKYWINYFFHVGCPLTNLRDGRARYGYKHSTSTIAKIVSSNGGKSIRDQYDNIYLGVKSAARLLRLDPSHIFHMLRGRRRHVGGYVFMYSQ